MIPRRIFAAVAAAFLLTRPAPAQQNIKPEPAAKDEFTLMTYNLYRFSYEDRDKDGQKDNFKPEDQVRAVIDVITNANPDVLAVEEIGDADSFDILKKRLADAGQVFVDSEYFVLPHATVGLGLLSKFPIVARNNITNETYSIADQELPVRRGYLCVDIQPNAKYRFRVIVAHLKSKLFHPLGQTEMRRNEARLLNKHVRRMVDRTRDLNLVVVGDMNDNIRSSTLRELIGQPAYLFDVRPSDAVGDIWTHFWDYQEEYARIDYILVNQNMLPEVVPAKCYLPRDPDAPLASDHRPVIAVFKASDQKAE